MNVCEISQDGAIQTYVPLGGTFTIKRRFMGWRTQVFDQSGKLILTVNSRNEPTRGIKGNKVN